LQEHRCCCKTIETILRADLWGLPKEISMKLLIGVLFTACSFLAQADVVTFITPSGSTTGGGPVDATATITTGAGTITVSLTNLESNPKDVAQNLSDFSFTLSNGTATGASYAPGSVDSAEEITVNGDNSFTLGSSLTTANQIGWVLSSPSVLSQKLT
jgi:hypothetical protein